MSLRRVSPKLIVPLGAALLQIGVAPSPLRAGGVVDTCSSTAFESAFDQALAGGGLVTLTCKGTNQLTTIKVIGLNTTIQSSTGEGWLVGAGSNSLFRIESGVQLTLIDLRLSGGRAGLTNGADGASGKDGGAGADGFGGAIRNEGGVLVATDVTFHNHQALGGAGGQGADVDQIGSQPGDGGRGGHGRGGAIYSLGGAVILTNCIFELNQARGGPGGQGGSSSSFPNDGAAGGHAGEGAGGAVFLSAGATLRAVGCRFLENETSGAQGGFGGLGQGLVFFDGTDGVSTPGQGGGVFQETGRGDLDDCDFNENVATGADGLAASVNAGNLEEAKGERGQLGLGGGLAVLDGSLLVRSSRFNDNWAAGGAGGNGGITGGAGDGGDGGDGAPGQGAAVHLAGASSGRLLDCSFARNTVTGGAGGFGAFGTTAFSFDGNDGGAGGGQGGAVYSTGTRLEINRCTFDGNDANGSDGLEGAPGNAFKKGRVGSRGGAAQGGGAYVAAGALTVTNATFHANAALAGDGGQGGVGGTGLAFATDGGDGGVGGLAGGGALWATSPQPAIIVHSTFATNRVVAGNGGLGGEPGDPILARPGNTGAPGEAIGASLRGDAGGILIRGTLLAHPGGSENAEGVLDDGYNLSSDDTPAFGLASSSLNQTDPQLGPLSANEGPTKTMAPSDSSPAIDFGRPVPSLLIDQRGLARDDLPDAGTYESGSLAPPLSIATSSGTLSILWPATGVAYTLQSSGSATSPSWSVLTGAERVDDTWIYPITPNSNLRFYRLRR